MFRKRRRPTPHFKIPAPYNPIFGEEANLRQDGIAPYCAMMQIAAEDTYDDYVICRGFDTRILRFIDYEAGNADKPGISVAKPFGKRMPNMYEVAEVYPAFLPTQGNEAFTGFRQVTYVPPSPVDVNWRLGQNPGYVDGGQEGGQPETLNDEIAILYDHNGKVINWLLIDSSAGLRGAFSGLVSGTGTQVGGDFDGLNWADVAIFEADDPSLIGTTERVYDRKGCIFDIDVTGYVVWAHELWMESLDDADLVKFWSADDRCCEAGAAVETGIAEYTVDSLSVPP